MSSILITGASRGIGFALAKELIARGHQVFGSVRTSEDAQQLASNIGTGFTPLVFDVTDDSAVAKAAAELDVPLDVLVNNAGVMGDRSANTIDFADFDIFAEVLAINTIAPLRVTQAFLPQLRRSNAPRILTISSQMGMLSYQQSNCIAYRASKSAVNKVMQGIATDLKDEKIAVQMLHPGWVRTDMGGDHADISVEESASGIADRVEKLTIAQTGTFVAYDGSAMPW